MFLQSYLPAIQQATESIMNSVKIKFSFLFDLETLNKNDRKRLIVVTDVISYVIL